MRIRDQVLTLNVNTSTGIIECIAGCRVELNAIEIAGLAIPNAGYTLRCVIIADDPGSNSDEILFTFPMSRTFSTVLDIFNADDIFRSSVSRDLLDEDENGADEIRARFTLVNNSNGQRVIKKTTRFQLVL